jgi:fumagillin biosynthesis dioxygenase
VMPPPWSDPLTANVIWCLTDVHAANGATLHIPGSQRYRTMADVPSDAIGQMVPFSAPAGSVIVMEGRVWHTSGRNTTHDEDRALLFGYYTKPFIRPQWNFTAALGPEVQAAMSPMMRYRLGLDVTLNMPSEELFGNLSGS